MPKGGARMNSGPPPDPEAQRRDRAEDRDGWVVLPEEGRTGPVPEWPLSAIPDADGLEERELEVWQRIWRTPQAVAWEQLGWLHDIAIYVRCMVIGERGNAKAMAEARQWSDRLGLNPAAMMRNRWKVQPQQVEEKPKTQRKGARDRLRVVDGDG